MHGPTSYDAAAPGDERDLIAALAVHGDLAAPVIGAEGPEGIPMDISWPRLHVAVGVPHMPTEDRADLISAGWHVVDPTTRTSSLRGADATTARAEER